jgi:hypothetical protein
MTPRNVRRRMGLLALVASSVACDAKPPATGSATVDTTVATSMPPNAGSSETTTLDAAFDRDGRDFLEAFLPPDDTVRTIAPAEVRLWDQLLVAELPDMDPLREIDASVMPWTQVVGEPVVLRDFASLQATAVLPAVTKPSVFAFAVTVRNAAGARQLTVVVQAAPR